MSSTAFDGDSIGPELSLADLALPPHVGERLAAQCGRDERFETAAAWIDGMRAALADGRGEGPTAADLCRAENGAHHVRIGDESASFVCAIDPLMVPFLRDRPATVRSETPVTAETVEIQVRADGAAAMPAEAVLSLGVTREPADAPLSPERVYEEVCPHIQAFASVDEYERWARDVEPPG